MSPLQRVGAATEERFLTITTKKPTDPDWFISVTRADPQFDARGIDMFAHIYMKDDVGPTRVPIQIKSSYRGRASYRAVHPTNVEAGVLVIVVHKNNSDANIRAYLFRLLQQVRTQHKKYEAFLQELLLQEMSPRGQDNEVRIRAQRKRKRP